jgi:hypothetical protein
MDVMTRVGVSVITGILSVLAFYYSISKKAEKFYEDTNEDTTGYFLIVGWIVMGLHKIYKVTFRRHHISALRMSLFLFGIIFLVMGIGIWFLI